MTTIVLISSFFIFWKGNTGKYLLPTISNNNTFLIVIFIAAVVIWTLRKSAMQPHTQRCVQRRVFCTCWSCLCSKVFSTSISEPWQHTMTLLAVHWVSSLGALWYWSAGTWHFEDALTRHLDSQHPLQQLPVNLLYYMYHCTKIINISLLPVFFLCTCVCVCVRHTSQTNYKKL